MTRARLSGSITVFMSLAGVLILAMLGTCLETARYTTCAGSGAEILRTGAEALFTEYSRPLYDHYGLFFLEDGGESYEKVISSYVADGLSSEPGFTDFLGGELTSLEIKNMTKVGDDEAKALSKEVTAYMERYLTGEMLSKLIEKIAGFTQAKETAEQIDKTVEEEKEDKKLDERILRLMYLVDGVRVSGSGSISIDHYFAKKFAVSSRFSGVDFGVTEGVVWEKMKKNIDKTPVEWDDLGQNTIRKVEEVLRKTETAIVEGGKLKSEYNSSKHSDMAARVIAGLPSLDGNKRVLEESLNVLRDISLDKKEKREKLDELWKDYDTVSLSFDYSGADQAEGDDANPLDALGDGMGDGLLGLVCTKKLSEKSIKKPDRYAGVYSGDEGSVSEDHDDPSECIDNLTSDEEVHLSEGLEDIASDTMEEFALDMYATEKFTGYTTAKESLSGKKKESSGKASGKTDGTDGGFGEKSDNSGGSIGENEGESDWKRALDYGWEYIIAGKKSDKDNLESVLFRILLIRAAMNFIAIMADGARRAEALAMATAVIGFTGLVFLIKFMQTLILIAWSFVEGMTDIAGLLQDRDVPVIKTSKQILTTLPEVFIITNEAITTRAKRFGEAQGLTFGYKEYVLMFMMMSSAATRRYRIMDLIDADMAKNGYKGFNIGKCTFDMELEGSFRYPSKFFKLPMISDILGRDLLGYSFTCLVREGYL